MNKNKQLINMNCFCITWSMMKSMKILQFVSMATSWLLHRLDWLNKCRFFLFYQKNMHVTIFFIFGTWMHVRFMHVDYRDTFHYQWVLHKGIYTNCGPQSETCPPLLMARRRLCMLYTGQKPIVSAVSWLCLLCFLAYGASAIFVL